MRRTNIDPNSPLGQALRSLDQTERITQAQANRVLGTVGTTLDAFGVKHDIRAIEVTRVTRRR